MQYKTYQEAKIANPDSEIYYSAARRLGDKGFFSTREDATSFHYKCKPENHCMTLESFLASGKNLFYGDLIIGPAGTILFVANAGVMNKPHDTDRDTYILKAKALENPAHEWVNGDECIAVSADGYVLSADAEARLNEKGVIMALFENNQGFDIAAVCYDNGECICWMIDLLRKPESPEQSLERQRLESAYHLACIAGVSNIWGNDITFDDFKKDEVAVKRWLAVVDEAKYLLNH